MGTGENRKNTVKHNFCLSCIAQSILQRSLGHGGKSERFKFAPTQQTIGQKLYCLHREALHSLLHCSEGLFICLGAFSSKTCGGSYA